MRYVDTTTASIWVQTRDTATVTVRVDGRAFDAATFAVHGHHYALVEVTGLEPGSVTPYTVEIDGDPVWPDHDSGPASGFPASVIATFKPGKPLRMAFGSCRTSVTHDEAGNKLHGVDAMRAYALHMAEDRTARWPDMVLFLGDQVYADETTDEMEEFIASRRDIEQPPWDELKDYHEYAELYRLAWTDPANRWLLSTLPSAMIFDDHDVRDDWNTSLAWKQKMEATSWWHERIVSGLASYWVYQHIGNLSPAERAEDEIWKHVVAAESTGEEADLTEVLDAFADRVDQQPETYRWSFARDIDDVRLVVVDSRNARVLRPGERSILDDPEMEWLDDQMRGGFRHLLVGTSLPFLLSPGLHHLEAWNEALVDGAWGRLGSKYGEKIRQLVDLEHWGAFQDGFQRVSRMALEVANGRRGAPPESITFLSGDVHHSYVSEVDRVLRSAVGELGETRSRIVQAVCSPIRNPLPRVFRFATALSAYGLAGPMGAIVAESAHVPDPPFTWRAVQGPWFDNNLATLEVTDEGLKMWWKTGIVVNGDHEHPVLEEVATVLVPPPDGSGPMERNVLPVRLLNRVSQWTSRVRRRRGARSR
jgi:hypothetical protein